MGIDKIIVAILGLGAIGFTDWFFLMKKDDKATVSKNNSVDIIVEGGYSPSVITIPSGQTTTLNFLRKDPSSCLEEVVLSELKIRKFLPLNKKVSISVTPTQPGEFPFVCGMNMFHGKIIVT